MTYQEIEVNDRKSFSDFLELLLADFKSNPEKWENNHLETFIEAMQRYTLDFEGYYRNVHPQLNPDLPTWRVFADILRGAVIYE